MILFVIRNTGSYSFKVNSPYLQLLLDSYYSIKIKLLHKANEEGNSTIVNATFFLVITGRPGKRCKQCKKHLQTVVGNHFVFRTF